MVLIACLFAYSLLEFFFDSWLRLSNLLSVFLRIYIPNIRARDATIINQRGMKFF